MSISIILLTSPDCDLCVEAEAKFKEQYKEELDSGDAEIINLEEDEGAQAFWAKHNIPYSPQIVITSDSKEGGKLITIIDPLAAKEEIEPGVSP